MAGIEDECREMRMILRGLAHEMGNALTVMGYSIRNFGKRPEIKEDENWSYINEDFDYICRLFKDLSAYNNSRDVIFEKVDINNLMSNVTKSLKEEYTENGVEIHYNEIKEDAIVLGDETKLKQVFVNIIKNAYEAIIVSEKGQAGKGYIDIHIYDKEDSYLIEIKDNGCGIKQENIKKVFEPMYTANKEGGTGLGLYICKNIVENHKGSINVSSVFNLETKVDIELKKMLL